MIYNPTLEGFFSAMPWLRCDANAKLFEQATTKKTFSGYREAYPKVESQLCIAPDYLEAWNEVLQEFPFYDNQANLLTFCTSLRSGELAAPVDAFRNMLSSPNQGGLSLNTEGQARQRAELQAAAAEKADKALRAKLIDEITKGGKDTYTWRDPQGRVVVEKSSHLPFEPTPRLVEINEVLTTQRSLEKADAATLKKYIPKSKQPVNEYSMDWPKLPPTLYLPGDTKPTVIDRAFILRADADFIRYRLVKIYGQQQIDDRLNGRS